MKATRQEHGNAALILLVRLAEIRDQVPLFEPRAAVQENATRPQQTHHLRIRWAVLDHLTHLPQRLDINLPKPAVVIGANVEGEDVAVLHSTQIILEQLFCRVAELVVDR